MRHDAVAGGNVPALGGEALVATVPGLAGIADIVPIAEVSQREARAAGIELSSVRVNVGGDFVGEPAVSGEIRYEVEVAGDAPEDRIRALIARVDEIAEIPNSLRQGTHVRLVEAKVGCERPSPGDSRLSS